MNRQNHRSGAGRPWAAVLVALVLLGAACGNDSNSSKVAANKTSTTTTTASSTTTSTEASATTTAAAATTTTAAAATAATAATPAATTATTAAPTTTTTAAPLTGDITVLAAASLTDSFNEMGRAFAAAHPGTSVKFSFDASSTLAGQANQGAPADVFASADDANMSKATSGGSAQNPTPFTKNRLAIIVGKGNPKGIYAVKDFERSGVSWVRCADGVPCGDYAKQILAAGGVDTSGSHAPKSLEANVKGVVTKVTSGSVDAGIVYVTDGKAASSTSETIDIPDNINVIANYPVARLKQSGHPAVADALIAFVLSAQGQGILAKYGFLPLS